MWEGNGRHRAWGRDRQMMRRQRQSWNRGGQKTERGAKIEVGSGLRPMAEVGIGKSGFGMRKWNREDGIGKRGDEWEVGSQRLEDRCQGFIFYSINLFNPVN